MILPLETIKGLISDSAAAAKQVPEEVLNEDSVMFFGELQKLIGKPVPLKLVLELLRLRQAVQ